MDKIVIRTKVITGISSKIIQEADDKISLTKLSERSGINYVLENIFDEKLLSYKQLNDEYYRFIENQSSEIFMWMYKISPEFGVVINKHIYICNYDSSINIQEAQLFSWEYVDSEKKKFPDNLQKYLPKKVGCMVSYKYISFRWMVDSCLISLLYYRL